uniref:Uncharacterized protein n=1 Tax=Strigops habroptila TaxID=2489341 RepID=A0A672VAQ6_STRHB
MTFPPVAGWWHQAAPPLAPAGLRRTRCGSGFASRIMPKISLYNSFHGCLMYAICLGELWMDSGSTSKLSQYGWRCTTKEIIYQQIPYGLMFSNRYFKSFREWYLHVKYSCLANLIMFIPSELLLKIPISCS